MNKRIRELAKQADNYAKQTVHYYMGQFDGLTWETKIKQSRDTKFAELIVLDCAEYLSSAMEVHNQQEQDLMNLAARKIQEHFGVEPW